MSKILILGCGDIGVRLAVLLKARGHEVTGLRRKPPESCPHPLRFIQGDIAVAGGLAAAGEDFDQIFFMPAPDRKNLESYKKLYAAGLENAQRHFSTRGRNPHWFFISSTSVYGQRYGEWVDETSPAEPDAETARYILAAEHKIRTHRPDSVVVRFSGIYGPRRDRLAKKLLSGDAVQFVPPHYTNRIHQDDCAAVLAFLFERRLRGLLSDHIYLASDDNPAPLWEVMAWMAERLGRPLPAKQRNPSTTFKNKRCANKKLKDLGFQFQYPSYREGYLEILEDTPDRTQTGD
ncbi:MAG: SDR family oxidoreductase [Gammaproteobacteria bacterium]